MLESIFITGVLIILGVAVFALIRLEYLNRGK